MSKALAVRSMFSSIARRYDLLNHVLSLNLDRRWRRAAVAAVAPRPGELALDVCTGTGDLALLLARTGARVTAADFCRPMLALAQKKSSIPSPLWVEADAMRLPFREEAFDVVTVAFGLRNLESPAEGLRHLAGALRPGGRICVLDFAQPRNRLFGAVYRFYFHRVLPRLGGLISGDGQAYAYLPRSVDTFLRPDEMVELLRECGVDAGHRALGLGAVTLVSGRRPIEP